MATFAQKVCLALIRFYQASAPLLRPRCRFWPTCSQYAYEAVEARGAARGTLLALRRLARCHPLGNSGFDPAPSHDE